MKQIYKYPFEVSGYLKLPLSQEAKILLVEDQHNVPTLWALIDPEQTPGVRRFHIYGTGHLIPHPERLTHVASWQSGSFVWHMFEEKEE